MAISTGRDIQFNIRACWREGGTLGERHGECASVLRSEAGEALPIRASEPREESRSRSPRGPTTARKNHAVAQGKAGPLQSGEPADLLRRLLLIHAVQRAEAGHEVAGGGAD